jgi:hypothetical protein
MHMLEHYKCEHIGNLIVDGHVGKIKMALVETYCNDDDDMLLGFFKCIAAMRT